MSKTDKTKPSWVRLRELGCEEHQSPWLRRPTFSVPSDFKWSHHENGVGPKHAKWAKRMKNKKNRRREVPWTQMRGHGYGDENMRFQ